MVELAQKLEPAFWDVARDKDLESVAKMKANGMEMADIPASMFAAIQQKTKPMLDDYLGRVPQAKPIVDKYLADLGRK